MPNQYFTNAIIKISEDNNYTVRNEKTKEEKKMQFRAYFDAT